MSQKSLAEMINERIEATELIVNLVAQKAKEDDLRDLRVLLIDTTSLLKRDPGIEAATDDLYAAAAAVVKSASSGLRPGARHLRCLRDARERFCSRLPGAAERQGPEDELRLKGLEAAYAVQLSRSSVESEGGEPYSSMAA